MPKPDSTTTTGRFRSSLLRAMLVPLIVVAALVSTAEYQLHQHIRAENQVEVLHRLSTLRAKLEGAINANLLLVRGLIATIAAEPDIDQARFARLAEELMRGPTLLRNIAAAPDLVIRLMYPIEGNEAAIGLDYRTHPTQKQAALEVLDRGEIVIAGPLDLVQGGIGLVARAPVYTADPNAESGRRLWGLVSSVIDVDRLYRQVGLDHDDPETQFALRGRDAQGSDGQVFFGNPALFEREPTLLDVSLPYGSWQLAGVPSAGWSAPATEHSVTRYSVLVIGLLALWMAFQRAQRTIERQRIQERLAVNEERFRSTFEQAAVGIAHVAPDGSWLRVNQKLCDIVGYTRDELMRLSFQEITHPDDLAADLRHVKRALDGEIDHYQMVKRYLRRTGEPIWINLTVSLVRRHDGLPSYFISVIEDISERMDTEQALRESEERFSRFMEHLPSGAFIVHPDSGRLLYFNRWLREHGGEAVQYDAGPEDFFDNEIAKRHHADNRRVLKQGFVRTEEELPGPDGRATHLETLRFLIPQQDGDDLIGGIITDISEEIAAQHALRDSEAQLRTMMETIPDIVFLKDLDGVYRAINPQLGKLLNLHPDEIIGKTDYDLFDQDMADDFRLRDQQVLSVEATVRFEEWVRSGCGEKEFFETLEAPVRDKDDAVVGVLGIARVITERKKLEAALAENEALFRTIFEQAGVGVAQVDGDSGLIQRANQRFAEIIGYPIDEIDARLSYRDIIHPDDIDRLDEQLDRIGGGDSHQFSLETRCLQEQGNIVWVNLNASVIESGDGDAPCRHIAILEDISDRKQALARLELKQFMVDHMGDACFLIDQEGHLLDVNQEACRSLEYDRTSLLRMAVWDVSASLERNQWPATRKRVQLNRHLTFETAHRTRTGREFPVEISIDLFVFESTEYFIALVRDISERRRAEELLNQANDRLEQRVAERTVELSAANRELEAFAYAASHDLRTPLRAIQGFQQALVEDLGDRLPPEATEYLREIDSGSKKMGHLIDGLLELSRSTRGDVKREPIDLGQIAMGIYQRLSQLHPERSVKLELRGDLTVNGDRNMLHTLMHNLVENAWKYTEGTEQAEILLKRSSGPLPVICIEDNGAGFDMAYANKLFIPFHRLHRSDEFPGIGIGLATVHRIIGRHGGWIRGEGETGKGARFCFSLEAETSRP